VPPLGAWPSPQRERRIGPLFVLPVSPRATAKASDGEGKIKGGGTHGRDTPPVAGGTLSATPAPMAHHTAIDATIAPHGRAGTVAPTFSERSE